MKQTINKTVFVFILLFTSFVHSTTITAERTSQHQDKAVLFLINTFGAEDIEWDYFKASLGSMISKLDKQTLVAVDIFSSQMSTFESIVEFFLPRNYTIENIPPTLTWMKVGRGLNMNYLPKSSVYGTENAVKRADKLLDDIAVSNSQRYVVFITWKFLDSVTNYKDILRNKPNTIVTCIGFRGIKQMSLHQLASSPSYSFWVLKYYEAEEAFERVVKGRSGFFKGVEIDAHFTNEFKLLSACNPGGQYSREMKFNITIKNSHEDECIFGGKIEISEIKRNEPFFGFAEFSLKQEIPPHETGNITITLFVQKNDINNIPYYLRIYYQDKVWGEEEYIIKLEAKIFASELHKAISKIEKPLHLLLLGPSGVGKTTLMNSIASLLTNTTRNNIVDPVCSGDIDCTSSTSTYNMSAEDPKMKNLFITDTSGANYSSSVIYSNLNPEYILSLIKGENNISMPVHTVILMLKTRLFDMKSYQRIKELYDEIRKLRRRVFFVSTHFDELDEREDYLPVIKERIRISLHAEDNFLCGSFTRSSDYWDVEAQFNTLKILDSVICD